MMKLKKSLLLVILYLVLLFGGITTLFIGLFSGNLWLASAGLTSISLIWLIIKLTEKPREVMFYDPPKK
jgi:membrane protease YdiL (CAAX protease family)